MDSKEFAEIRKRLEKTQKEMAIVLGTSVKAVHSYEQGWRTVPAHVQKQLFFLLTRRMGDQGAPCWSVTKCEPERKRRCPAWEFQAGDMCWFISGTLCGEKRATTWDDKVKRCKECVVLDLNTLLGK